jgi:O-antigen ligase
VLTALVLLALAWGVLAFGAVYPWSYWPLLAAAAAVGLYGVLVNGRGPRLTPLAVALGAIAAVMLLQLVPVPPAILAAVDPARDRLLREYDLPYALTGTAHPLSIRPAGTRLALACFVAFALFAIGLSRQLSTRRTVHLVHGLLVLGVVVAVAGLVQKAAGVDRIYGFWTPNHRPYQIFGPFVNKNHYAGWMIMTLALALGYVYGGIATAMHEVRPGWRNRVLWFSTPAANQLILAAVAIPVMVIALLMTLSRSGIGALGVALLLGGWAALRRVPGRPARRGVAVAYVVALVIAFSGWTGAGAVVDRFGTAETSFQGRVGAWRDASRIVGDFPLVGTGVNTFGTAMIYYQTSRGGWWDAAHNEFVQIAAEGGLLLGGAVLAALALFVRQVRRRLRDDAPDSMGHWLRVGALTGLVAIGVQSFFDFSLQIPGNALLFALLVAIALRASAAPARADLS